MTTGTGTNAPAPSADAPKSWQDLRADGDIQFAPVEIPEIPPREPTWLDNLFEALAELIKPLGALLAAAWPVLKWILLAILVAAVLYTLYRMFGPSSANRTRADAKEGEDTDWQPDRHAAIALLEEADRLASEGLFDEATHLLLQRSVGQIASAQPGWVEPSTTARELASLEELPQAARGAFGVIAERVERSLFALRGLDRNDWETARAAYAEFALTRIDGALLDGTPA